MKINHKIVVLLTLISGFGFTTSALALAILLGDVEQGEKVHLDNCTRCHIAQFGDDGNKIYTREDHKIKTIEGLMQQVQFCNANPLQGALSEENMDDITAYLNEKFYLFDD